MLKAKQSIKLKRAHKNDITKRKCANLTSNATDTFTLRFFSAQMEDYKQKQQWGSERINTIFFSRSQKCSANNCNWSNTELNYIVKINDDAIKINYFLLKILLFFHPVSIFMDGKFFTTQIDLHSMILLDVVYFM